MPWSSTPGDLGDQGQTAKGLQVIQTLDAWAPGDPTLLGAKIMLLRQQGLHELFPGASPTCST